MNIKKKSIYLLAFILMLFTLSACNLSSDSFDDIFKRIGQGFLPYILIALVIVVIVSIIVFLIKKFIIDKIKNRVNDSIKSRFRR